MTSTEKLLGKIKVLRKEMGFKQEDLAKKLKIDRTTYVRKEQGAIPITTEEWFEITSILNIDFADIFGSIDKRLVEFRERLLIELYRSLNKEEKQDLLSSIQLVLKSVKRKKVQDTLSKLIKK